MKKPKNQIWNFYLSKKIGLKFSEYEETKKPDLEFLS